MTVIAAIRANDRVYMAADSLTTDARGVCWPSEKLFRTSAGEDTVLLGTAGVVAFAPMVRHDLKIDDAPSDDDADAWAHAVARTFTELARERHLVSDDSIDGVMFLAWQDRLWEVSDYLALPIETYATIGSGGEIALGALDVQWNYSPIRDRGRDTVTRAVEAACHWQRSCREPIVAYSTNPASSAF